MEDITQIIIIEDDATIRTVLSMALSVARFHNVKSFARGDEGIAAVKMYKPDLVLLDVMLPGLDGFTIARRIREIPDLAATRIIMLTAKTQPDDIVRGLECGADDYVTKPFDRKVLIARVKAVLRRGLPASEGMTFDGLAIDKSSYSAMMNGTEMKLSPGEFKILLLLIENRGRVLTRQRILDAVTSDDEKGVTERTIDVQIATLRKKLGDWAEHIETIRGVGYRVNLSPDSNRL